MPRALRLYAPITLMWFAVALCPDRESVMSLKALLPEYAVHAIIRV